MLLRHFRRVETHVLEPSTHPSVVQSPHSETIHGPGKQVAHGALELWPVVHLRRHVLGLRHLHTVLGDLTATFRGRNI